LPDGVSGQGAPREWDGVVASYVSVRSSEAIYASLRFAALRMTHFFMLILACESETDFGRRYKRASEFFKKEGERFNSAHSTVTMVLVAPLEP
jgi:hypothetical protein